MAKARRPRNRYTSRLHPARYISASATPSAVLPAILPFVFAVLWASSYVAAKIGLADISPYAFVAIRLAIAAAAAIAMVLALKRPWEPVRRRWLHLLIGGALAHGLALATAHKALISVAATPTALVHAFHPILTAALGVFLLRERFRVVAMGRRRARARRRGAGRAARCGLQRHDAAGVEPVRAVRRHALPEEIRRRRAALRGDRRAIDRRRAAGRPDDGVPGDAACAGPPT